jgi:2-hydroxychromene-2-carboxylate isomerase
MPGQIDYYFSCSSPWAYLGHADFIAVARKHGFTVEYKPLPLGRLFPETGGLPLAQRHPARQNYRMIELQRWRDKKHIDLNLHPKFWPFDPSLADRTVIALTAKTAVERFLPQAFAAVFAADANLADEAVIAQLLVGAGLDAAQILAAAKSPAVMAHYEANLAEAAARGVFGAPSYVLAGEIFWGQDRIGCLDEALAAGRTPYRADA